MHQVPDSVMDPVSPIDLDFNYAFRQDDNGTANSTSTDEETNEAQSANTDSFLTVLGIGLAATLVLMLLFSFLRTRVPDVYQLRALLNTWRTHNNFSGARVGVIEPRPSDAFFGWVKPVFSIDEDQVVRKVGLDAAMFFRFIRTAFFMSAILALFGMILLMPVYGTGSEHERDSKIRGLRRVTLSNVTPQNGRFWMTVITEFFTAAIVIVFLTIDFKHYANLRRQYCASENPSNYAVVVYDIPEDSRSEAAIRERFEQIVPGQVASVCAIRTPGKAVKLLGKLDKAVAQRESAELVASLKDTRPLMRPGFLGFMMCFKPKVDAIDHWSNEQQRLADEIHDEGTNAVPTPSAIVMLSNKRAASLLVQANSRTGASAWQIERAPEPKALHWPAFGVPGYQAEMRTIIIAVLIGLFTLFWTVPAAFLAGLASIRKMVELEPLKWAEGILNWSPYLVDLIEGALPPVVMAVIISLIPILFRAVIGFERLSSVSTIEKKTRDYFYMFTVYGSFLAFLIGASFFRELETLRKEWIKIVDLLAVAIPGTSLYFATFILLKSLIPFPLMLSGLIRVVLRWVLLKFAKTERQKRAARSTGFLFPYFQQYGFGMFTLFLSLAFSSLAPLVPLMATLYFGVAYVCFRYVILFTCYSEWQGGGELYPGTFWGTMAGLLLKQLVVIAVLGLKKAAVPAAMCFIPLVITLCCTFIVAKRYERIALYGSLLDFTDTDDAEYRSSQSDAAKKRSRLVPLLRELYQQPAGTIREYDNLSGVAELKDVYSEVDPSEDPDQNDAVHSETFDDKVGYVPDAAADREEV